MKNQKIINIGNLIMIIITIVIAGITFILVNNKTTDLFVATLSSFIPILGMMILDLKIIRKKLSNLLEKKIVDEYSAEDLFFQSINCKKIRKILKKAKSISILGITLKDSLKTYYPILNERIISGKKVKIIIIEDKDIGIKAASFRCFGETEESIAEDLNATQKLIAKLQENSQEKICKTIDFPPSFGMLLVDEDSVNAKAIIKVYGHHEIEAGYLLHFWLISKKDNNWYAYFKEQFIGLWDKKENAIMATK